MLRITTFVLAILFMNVLVSQTRATIFYPMEQTPERGTTISDATTNTSGLINNKHPQVPASVTGKVHNAFNFYNSNAYVEVAESTHTAALGNTNTTNGLSLSLWVNYKYEKLLFDRLAGLRSAFDILVVHENGVGEIEFRFDSDGSSEIKHFIKTSATDNVLDGEWHHIAVTFDFTSTTDNLKVYVDGALSSMKAATVTESFAAPAGSTLKIGTRHDTGRQFAGAIDEFLAFEEALSANEINQIYTSTGTALQDKASLFYKLNETPVENGSVNDATANTTATLKNALFTLPFLANDGPAGFSNHSWDFRKSYSFIEVAENATTQKLGNTTTTTGLSIGMWVDECFDGIANNRLAGLEGVFDINMGQSSGIGTIQFRFDSDGSGAPNYNITTTGEENIFDGNWRHVIATLDFETNTDNLKLYVDGALSSMQSVSVSRSFSPNALETIKIGTRHNSGHPFSGRLDEFIVFDKAITAAEVTQLVTEGGYSFSNLSPVVELGNDTIINPAQNPFNMLATINDDGLPANPGALTINWTKLAGAGTVTFSNPTSGTTTIDFSQNDTYQLEIAVTDGDFIVKDTIQITIGNIPPAVFAGHDTIITLPSNSILLKGSASDVDNFPAVLSTTWEKISGPGSVNFELAALPITDVTFGAAGTYLLRLGANDGDLQIYDTVQILVNGNTEAGGYTYAWDEYDPATFGNDNLVQNFTGVRAIAHAPEIGIHPRVYFGPDELADIQNRLQNTTAGQQAFKQIHAYTTLLRVGNAGYNRSAAYAIDDYGQARISNTGKWDSKDIYFKLINRDPTALDGVDNKRRYLLASVMTLEAFECYVMAGQTDGDTGETYDNRAIDLAKAMTYWAELVFDEAELYPDNYHHFGGIHMALCYDMNYNSMTTAQQDQVRATLAKLIWEHPLYGHDTKYYATTSNWVGLNTFQLLINLSIEGEAGYDPNLTKEYMRSYRNFLNHGWYDSGAGYEGLGKNYMVVTSMVAAAKRGYSLLGHPKLKAYGNKFLPAIAQPYGFAFTGTDAWGGSGWDTEIGGYKFNAADAIGLKWTFPNDDAIDFMWRNYIGGYWENKASSGYVYQSIFPATSGYLNYLVTAAIFADDYQTGDFGEKNEAALQAKSYFAPERGLAILRSGYEQEDLALHFHVRQDMGGHTYADRLNFALSGLGRIWVRYSFGANYHESEYHSMVMIDDKGVPLTPRDGVKARQPATVLNFEEKDNMVTASGDATYAYSWEWEWESRDANTPHSKLDDGVGWEEVTETWNDFRMIAGDKYYHELPFYEYAHWWHVDRFEKMIKRPYNPMEKVYRTVSMFRDCKPFVLIADDVQKDTAAHNYKAYIQLAEDLTISSTDVNLQADDYRNDIILKEPTGNRKMLVRVLNNTGQCVDNLTTGNTAFDGLNRAGNTIVSDASIPATDSVLYVASQSITLNPGFTATAGSNFTAQIGGANCTTTLPAYLELTDPDINGNNLMNRLVIEANEVSPEFKYLLFPFMDGETLPTTKWNSAKNELTVICEGTEQKIAFSEINGSTRMELIPVESVVATPAESRTNLLNEVKIVANELSIIPQPFVDQFEINYQTTSTSELQLQVVNLLGQTIYNQSWQVTQGVNQLRIPTGSWLAGNYFLQVVENGVVVESLSLVKQD